MDCSEPKIADAHTIDYGYGSKNVTTAEEAIRRIDEFEYKKLALLNYQNDLMNKLAECSGKISEIDHEIRAINLEVIERIKINRRLRPLHQIESP